MTGAKPVAASQTAPPALEALLRERSRFLAFVERRVGDASLAEEILQEAFIKCSAAADTIRDEESVAAWFYRVPRNAVIDLHRRRGTEVRGLARLARLARSSRSKSPRPTKP